METEFVCLPAPDLLSAPSLVQSEGHVAGGAGVGHVIAAVNAERDTAAHDEAENTGRDPGKGTMLRVSRGGDGLLAVWAHHGDGPVPEQGAGHGHHLHRGGGLGLLHGLGWI